MSIRIAVIDSGVQPGHPHIEATQLREGVSIRAGAITADGTLDRLGHGTAVTAAIQEKAPEALIHPVRVFHEHLRCTAGSLIAAIGWAADQGVDIVNLSLGTPNPDHADAFAEAVARARLLVVAPVEANGGPCWPGALAEELPNVIGTALDWDVPRETYRVAGDAIFAASGYPRPIPGVPQQRNLHGISFATAQLTGFVARALAGSNSAEVLEVLKSGR